MQNFRTFGQWKKNFLTILLGTSHPFIFDPKNCFKLLHISLISWTIATSKMYSSDSSPPKIFVFEEMYGLSVIASMRVPQKKNDRKSKFRFACRCKMLWIVRRKLQNLQIERKVCSMSLTSTGSPKILSK